MSSLAGIHQRETGMGTQLLHNQQEHTRVWDTAKEPSGKHAPERRKGKLICRTRNSHQPPWNPERWSCHCQTHGDLRSGIPWAHDVWHSTNQHHCPSPPHGTHTEVPRGIGHERLLRDFGCWSLPTALQSPSVKSQSQCNRRRKVFFMLSVRFAVRHKARRESASLIFKCCVVWI